MNKYGYVLNQFATEEECRVERDRVGFEMAEAYPYERTFVIVCGKRKETPHEQA